MYEERTVPDLKLLLKGRGLKVSGRKADLVARLEANDLVDSVVDAVMSKPTFAIAVATGTMPVVVAEVSTPTMPGRERNRNSYRNKARRNSRSRRSYRTR